MEMDDLELQPLEREGSSETVTIVVPPRRDREKLREVLGQRHVNMIAFSGTLGIGIFLTTGKILHNAGPGGAILAFVLTGTVISSVIASLGEMTALMPVKGPITEYASRYVDSAVGFATGWIYWFAYTTVFAAQVTASASLIQFNYSEDIKWTVGLTYSPVIWIVLLLAYMISVNLLPVRWYGEFEYICGVVKMFAITGLILLMIIITNGGGGLPHIGNKCLLLWVLATDWKGNWGGFFARNFTTNLRNQEYSYSGDTGRLLGVWTAMTSAIFSYFGMDIVAATAAETREYGNGEKLRMATRKISLRIVLLYFFAIVSVSFAVPYDDVHFLITNHDEKSGSSSPFMVAIVNAKIRTLPHILNGFFIFSSSSAGVNALYVASRTLHALAASGKVVEGPIARRLKRCKCGVPMYAVAGSGIFGFLAFMSTKAEPEKVLSGLMANSSVSITIVYMVISLTYLCFFKGLAEELDGKTQRREYRDEDTYPYKSHFQYLRAVYACFGCFLFIFFNGWQSFLGGLSSGRFLTAYISVFVFIVLVLGNKANGYFRHNCVWSRDVSKQYADRQRVENAERKSKIRKCDTPKAVVMESLRLFWVWIV